MEFDTKHLREAWTLQSVITYSAPKGTELRPPLLPKSKEDKQPQVVQPYEADGKSMIDLDLPARGARRVEPIIRSLEEEGVLPNYTVSGVHTQTGLNGEWSLTSQSDRLGDVTGEARLKVKALADRKDWAGLARFYPLAFLFGLIGATDQKVGNGDKKLSHESLPKLLAFAVPAQGLADKNQHYVRAAGDASKQLSGSRTVYVPTKVTVVERLGFLALHPLAARLGVGTDPCALVADLGILLLLAVEEGLPDRSGNSFLVPESAKIVADFGWGKKEEIVFTQESLVKAQEMLKTELRTLSKRIYEGKAPSGSLGASASIGATVAKRAAKAEAKAAKEAEKIAAAGGNE